MNVCCEDITGVKKEAHAGGRMNLKQKKVQTLAAPQSGGSKVGGGKDGAGYTDLSQSISQTGQEGSSS
jgi:hypothetical protein